MHFFNRLRATCLSRPVAAALLIAVAGCGSSEEAQEPFLAIAGAQEFEPGRIAGPDNDDSRLKVWQLRGRGVQKVTARLVVFSGQKKIGEARKEHTGFSADGGEFNGQLYVSIRHGKVFGAADTWAPAFGLEGLPSREAFVSRPDSLLFRSSSQPGAGGSIDHSPRLPSRELVFWAYAGAPEAPVGRYQTPDELETFAKRDDISAVVALFLEWE